MTYIYYLDYWNQMKNLGTSLRRGVKIMNNLIYKNIYWTWLNPIEKPRNITAARVGNTNNLSKYLILISLYAFGLKTAPASQLKRSKSITIKHPTYLFNLFLKVGAVLDNCPQWNTLIGMGPPNTCSKMAIRRLTCKHVFLS